MIRIENFKKNKIIIFIVFFILVFCNLQASASGFSGPVVIKNESPFEVYESFINSTVQLEDDYKDYVNGKTKNKLRNLLEDLARIRHLLDLSEIPPANKVREGDNSIAYLYDIFARLPPVDLESIPGYKDKNETISLKDLPTKWTVPGTSIQIVRIEEGPFSGEYKFSANSIKNLEKYYENIINYPILNDRDFLSFFLERSNATGYLIPDSLSRNIPDFFKKHYFNTPLWKVVFVFFSFVLFLFICFFWFRFLLRKNKLDNEFKNEGLKILMPIGFLVLIFIFDKFIVTQINPVGSLANFFGLSMSIFYFLALSWFSWAAVYFISGLLVFFLGLFSKEIDKSFLKLINKLFAIIASIFVLINGFDQIGIPALGIVAGFGVGGIAIALASQSTIENLFGGLSLFIDKPFSVGDKISFNKQSAQILHVGPRSTRLRVRDGSLCTVPNSDLAKMHIVNYSLRDSFYINQRIELRNDSKSCIVKELLDLINSRVLMEEVIEKKDGWPRVKLVEIDTGRIVIRIQAVVLTTDYSNFLSLQEGIILDILSFLEKLNIKLARNIYYE